MLKIKLTSSLEKVFKDSRFDEISEISTLSALKNERISFQIAAEIVDTEMFSEQYFVKLSGELAKYATVREVISVPVTLPTFPCGFSDDNYLRKKPGLYPDLLMPLRYTDSLRVNKDFVSSLWVEIDLRDKGKIIAAEKPLTITFSNEKESAEVVLNIEILDAELPSEDITFTEWFYTDCLANFYNVEVFSEKHWEIIENFARTAVNNGINLLLTPTFTPPLDTAVGGERLTTQLVGVTFDGEKYEFDFTLLDRWIEMCDRVGVKYFEIAHFFTQWGAVHAPKVMATVNGEYKRIFGWETDAVSAEYTFFLRSFIKAFLEHMKARGDDKRCYFHISDEPNLEQLESYKAAKDSIKDLLCGYPIMDALSNYDFYSKGIVDLPIPANNHIAQFLENKVEGLWTYYCCGQWNKVSNRFIDMPSARNRSIGMQMYKHSIVGFLHWGYNFYNTQYSYSPIDPYRDTSGDGWVPAGDCFCVYPAPDGTAYETMRIIVFYDALQDVKAMKLAERLCGRDAVISAIEDAFGREITFDECARTPDEILRVRMAVNNLIKKNL